MEHDVNKKPINDAKLALSIMLSLLAFNMQFQHSDMDDQASIHCLQKNLLRASYLIAL